MVFSSHLFVFYFLPAALGLYYLSGRWRVLIAALLGPAAVALYWIEPNRLLLTVLLTLLAMLLLLKQRQRQHLMLTGLSYLFYGWANPAFVLLMAFSTVVDYIAGLVIARRALLPIGWAWRRAGTRGSTGPARLMRAITLTLTASVRLLRRPPVTLPPGVTFFIVLIAWVFFRAESLTAAVDYLQAMFGFGQAQAGAGLIGALIYDRFYLAVLGLALVISFFAPQSWDWTRRLTLPRAFACFVLLWAALAMLESQAYNPFIYFIF